MLREQKVHLKSCQKENSTQLTNTKGTSYRMLNLFFEPLKGFSSVKIIWHYCLSYVEKSLPLWIPCFSVNSRFITGWQLQARWLSQTFSLMNYTLTRTKPQTRLYHLKGRSPRPKNSLQFPPKKSQNEKQEEGWKERIKEKHVTMDGVGWVEAIGNVAFIRDITCWFQFANYAYM